MKHEWVLRVLTYCGWVVWKSVNEIADSSIFCEEIVQVVNSVDLYLLQHIFTANFCQLLDVFKNESHACEAYSR